MTGLRNRLEPAARVVPDLGLWACLVLPWITGVVPFWVHLAYIFVALSAFDRPENRRVAARVAVVAGVGGTALLVVPADAGAPIQDLLEIPALGALALLFAAFARRRTRTEQDILRDRTRLARLIDGIPLAVIAFDGEARVATWNSCAELLFGWRAEEVIGRSNPIVTADQRDESNELFARIATGERLRGVEVTRRARDGSTLELALYSAPIGGEGALVLYDDIRERKRAERERDQAQHRFRELIEALPLVTYIDHVDEHATNVYTSPQVVDLLGWRLGDWQDDPHFFEKLLHPDDRERVMGEVVQANEGTGLFDSEYRLRHQDGHYVWVRDRSAILDDGGSEEPSARGFLLDITQQKRLEAQLLQSQKMDALGQFAGGIAHDFNNLLTGIGGYADLAAGATEPESVVARCLDGIRTAAGEAASLTSRLLAFSRRNVPERALVDVNAIVREAASLLERLVRADLRVNLELAPTLPAVAADLAQLKQVVLNLALNARDAMTDGGTLTIETSHVADSVVLRVRDTGVGMDAATRSRALEPFFTTKPEGQGTGLGLSVVYGVIDALGGRLSIDSAVGLGTIVEIALPASEGIVGEADEPERAAPAGGAGRVLVVEDRDVVRNLARDVLESSGFDVVAVAGGREALAAFAADAPFNLLLTDVVMPEMSGPELAHQLRGDRPALPVLYMSGYTDDVLDPHELSHEATAFLRKPFGNADLIAAVHSVLDGRGNHANGGLPAPRAEPRYV
ncbi:MAG: PAS domain S-box protein [Thermoleophilia bacterium]|nr:PAS domain S-box protein [Thermoleophilia bacterium]